MSDCRNTWLLVLADTFENLKMVNFSKVWKTKDYTSLARKKQGGVKVSTWKYATGHLTAPICSDACLESILHEGPVN